MVKDKDHASSSPIPVHCGESSKSWTKASKNCENKSKRLKSTKASRDQHSCANRGAAEHCISVPRVFATVSSSDSLCSSTNRANNLSDHTHLGNQVSSNFNESVQRTITPLVSESLGSSTGNNSPILDNLSLRLSETQKLAHSLSQGHYNEEALEVVTKYLRDLIFSVVEHSQLTSAVAHNIHPFLHSENIGGNLLNKSNQVGKEKEFDRVPENGEPHITSAKQCECPKQVKQNVKCVHVASSHSKHGTCCDSTSQCSNAAVGNMCFNQQELRQNTEDKYNGMDAAQICNDSHLKSDKSSVDKNIMDSCTPNYLGFNIINQTRNFLSNEYQMASGLYNVLGLWNKHDKCQINSLSHINKNILSSHKISCDRQNISGSDISHQKIIPDTAEDGNLVEDVKAKCLFLRRQSLSKDKTIAENPKSKVIGWNTSITGVPCSLPLSKVSLALGTCLERAECTNSSPFSNSNSKSLSGSLINALGLEQVNENISEKLPLIKPKTNTHETIPIDLMVNKSRENLMSHCEERSSNCEPKELEEKHTNEHVVPSLLSVSATQNDSSSISIKPSTYRGRPFIPPDKFFFQIKSIHHMKLPDGQKLYACDICSGVYQRAFSLKRHYLRSHINYRHLTERDISNCGIVVGDKMAVQSGTNTKIYMQNSKIISVGSTLSQETLNCNHIVEEQCTTSDGIKTETVSNDNGILIIPCVSNGTVKLQGESTYSCEPIQDSKSESMHANISLENSSFKEVIGTTTSDIPIHFPGLYRFDSKESFNKHLETSHMKTKLKIPKPDIAESNKSTLVVDVSQTTNSDVTANSLPVIQRVNLKETSQSSTNTLNESSVAAEKETINENKDSINKPADLLNSVGDEFRYTCGVCQKMFTNYVNMCRHRRLAHGTVTAKTKKDKQGPKDFETASVCSSASSQNNGSSRSQSPAVVKTLTGSPAKVKAPARPQLTQQFQTVEISEKLLDPETLFYSKVASNIRENLLHHLDGKLECSDNVNKEKEPERSIAIDRPKRGEKILLKLDLVSSVALNGAPHNRMSLLAQSISSEVSKVSGRRDGLVHKVSWEKYNFPKNYDGRGDGLASYIKDMSHLDISTQLVMRQNLQRLNSEPTSPNTKDEIDNSDFDFPRGLCLMKNDVAKTESISTPSSPKPELSRTNSSPSVPSCMDVKDKSIIELDCPKSSGARRKSLSDLKVPALSSGSMQRDFPQDSALESAVELSGEWVRPRKYICGACGERFRDLYILEDHKYSVHPNVWCTHLEFEESTIAGMSFDDKSNSQLPFPGSLCRRFLNPTGALTSAIVVPPTKASESSCTKCSKVLNSLSDLHRHMLECGGDNTWMLTMVAASPSGGRRNRKWRPFGSRRRRQQGRRGMKRNIPSSPMKLPPYRARHRATDIDSIQRMISNLPAKRATRRVIQFSEDDIKTRSQATIHSVTFAPSLPRTHHKHTIGRHRLKSSANEALKFEVKKKKCAISRVLSAASAKKHSKPLSDLPLTEPAGLVVEKSSTFSDNGLVNNISAEQTLKQVPQIEDTDTSEASSKSKEKWQLSRNVLSKKRLSAMKGKLPKTLLDKEDKSQEHIPTKSSATNAYTSSAVSEEKLAEKIGKGRGKKVVVSTKIMRKSLVSAKLRKKKSPVIPSKTHSLEAKDPSATHDILMTIVPRRSGRTASLTRDKDSAAEDKTVSLPVVDTELHSLPVPFHSASYAQEDEIKPISNASTSVAKESSNILETICAVPQEENHSEDKAKRDLTSDIDNSRKIKLVGPGKGKKIEIGNANKKTKLKKKIEPEGKKTKGKGYTHPDDQISETNICEGCGLQFDNTSAYGRHMKTCIYVKKSENMSQPSIDATNIVSHQCNKCLEVFNLHTSLVEHSKVCTLASKESEVVKRKPGRPPKIKCIQNDDLNLLTTEEIKNPVHNNSDIKMPELQKEEPVVSVKRVGRPKKIKESSDEIPVLSPASKMEATTQANFTNNEILSKVKNKVVKRNHPKEALRSITKEDTPLTELLTTAKETIFDSLDEMKTENNDVIDSQELKHTRRSKHKKYLTKTNMQSVPLIIGKKHTSEEETINVDKTTPPPSLAEDDLETTKISLESTPDLQDTSCFESLSSKDDETLSKPKPNLTKKAKVDSKDDINSNKGLSKENLFVGKVVNKMASQRTSDNDQSSPKICLYDSVKELENNTNMSDSSISNRVDHFSKTIEAVVAGAGGSVGKNVFEKSNITFETKQNEQTTLQSDTVTNTNNTLQVGAQIKVSKIVSCCDEVPKDFSKSGIHNGKQVKSLHKKSNNDLVVSDVSLHHTSNTSGKDKNVAERTALKIEENISSSSSWIDIDEDTLPISKLKEISVARKFGLMKVEPKVLRGRGRGRWRGRGRGRGRGFKNTSEVNGGTNYPKKSLTEVDIVQELSRETPSIDIELQNLDEDSSKDTALSYDEESKLSEQVLHMGDHFSLGGNRLLRARRDQGGFRKDTASRFGRRESRARSTRCNLSYEEMYTSSDVASEADSQDFDAQQKENSTESQEKLVHNRQRYKKIKISKTKNTFLRHERRKKKSLRRWTMLSNQKKLFLEEKFKNGENDEAKTLFQVTGEVEPEDPNTVVKLKESNYLSKQKKEIIEDACHKTPNLAMKKTAPETLIKQSNMDLKIVFKVMNKKDKETLSSVNSKDKSNDALIDIQTTMAETQIAKFGNEIDSTHSIVCVAQTRLDSKETSKINLELKKMEQESKILTFVTEKKVEDLYVIEENTRIEGKVIEQTAVQDVVDSIHKDQLKKSVIKDANFIQLSITEKLQYPREFNKDEIEGEICNFIKTNETQNVGSSAVHDVVENIHKNYLLTLSTKNLESVSDTSIKLSAMVENENCVHNELPSQSPTNCFSRQQETCDQIAVLDVVESVHQSQLKRLEDEHSKLSPNILSNEMSNKAKNESTKKEMFNTKLTNQNSKSVISPVTPMRDVNVQNVESFHTLDQVLPEYLAVSDEHIIGIRVGTAMVDTNKYQNCDLIVPETKLQKENCVLVKCDSTEKREKAINVENSVEQSTLELTKDTVTDDPELFCEACHESFTSSFNLAKHKLTSIHIQKENHTSDICDGVKASSNSFELDKTSDTIPLTGDCLRNTNNTNTQNTVSIENKEILQNPTSSINSIDNTQEQTLDDIPLSLLIKSMKGKKKKSVLETSKLMSKKFGRKNNVSKIHHKTIGKHNNKTLKIVKKVKQNVFKQEKVKKLKERGNDVKINVGENIFKIPFESSFSEVKVKKSTCIEKISEDKNDPSSKNTSIQLLDVAKEKRQIIKKSNLNDENEKIKHISPKTTFGTNFEDKLANNVVKEYISSVNTSDLKNGNLNKCVETCISEETNCSAHHTVDINICDTADTQVDISSSEINFDEVDLLNTGNTNTPNDNKFPVLVEVILDTVNEQIDLVTQELCTEQTESGLSSHVSSTIPDDIPEVENIIGDSISDTCFDQDPSFQKNWFYYDNCDTIENEMLCGFKKPTKDTMIETAQLSTFGSDPNTLLKEDSIKVNTSISHQKLCAVQQSEDLCNSESLPQANQIQDILLHSLALAEQIPLQENIQLNLSPSKEPEIQDCLSTDFDKEMSCTQDTQLVQSPESQEHETLSLDKDKSSNYSDKEVLLSEDIPAKASSLHIEEIHTPLQEEPITITFAPKESHSSHYSDTETLLSANIAVQASSQQSKVFIHSQQENIIQKPAAIELPLHLPPGLDPEVEALLSLGSEIQDRSNFWTNSEQVRSYNLPETQAHSNLLTAKPQICGIQDNCPILRKGNFTTETTINHDTVASQPSNQPQVVRTSAEPPSGVESVVDEPPKIFDAPDTKVIEIASKNSTGQKSYGGIDNRAGMTEPPEPVAVFSGTDHAVAILPDQPCWPDDASWQGTNIGWVPTNEVETSAEWTYGGAEWVPPETGPGAPDIQWIQQEGTQFGIDQLQPISSLGSILDSVNQILNTGAGTSGEQVLLNEYGGFSSTLAAGSVMTGELVDLQRAMGATDEEMLMLQKLGEDGWPLENADLMDLDNQRSRAEGGVKEQEEEQEGEETSSPLPAKTSPKKTNQNYVSEIRAPWGRGAYIILIPQWVMGNAVQNC
ncbi:unnamed protein product [Timema podura]|uniref:C2H2-type domain-containing protein n=1 Tax=Timema podura TaxID=61482 RepID=A0ABN7NRY6_TIMPD|nr:unnamed protein product [Timema podura]